MVLMSTVPSGESASAITPVTQLSNRMIRRKISRVPCGPPKFQDSRLDVDVKADYLFLSIFMWLHSSKVS